MPKWVWAVIGLAIAIVILSVAYRIIKKSGATVKVGKIFEATVEVTKTDTASLPEETQKKEENRRMPEKYDHAPITNIVEFMISIMGAERCIVEWRPKESIMSEKVIVSKRSEYRKSERRNC